MEIISNKIIIFKTITVFLFFVFAAIIFFWFKNPQIKEMETKKEPDINNTMNNEKNNYTFREDILIDKTSDIRGLGYSGQRKIVQDEDGNIFVAYRKEVGNYFEIFVARIFEENGEIKVSGTEKPVAKIGMSEQRVPSIDIDKGGTIHLVWYGSDDTKASNNRQIKYVRSTDKGKTWSDWKNIAYISGFNPREDYWQEHPFVLAGQHEAVYVVWEGKDENSYQQQIKFIKSTDGGVSWSNWKNIKETPGKTQSRPSLVENDGGELFATMYSSEGNEFKQQQIQVAMSKDNGETWTDWQIISDPKFDSRHASSAMDSEGNVHVVWRSQISENGTSKILYRNFNEFELSDIKVISDSRDYQFFPNVNIFKSKDKNKVFVSWMESKSSFNFPRENPLGGVGFISLLEDGNFKSFRSWGNGEIFYPNISEQWLGQNTIPVLYCEQKDNNFLDVKLKFFDVD